MRDLPDFEAWAVFASVVEARSFGRAAVELGLSPATVSKLVSRLERRVGGALLSRTSRRFSLTSLGDEVAERAHRLVAEAVALEASASNRVQSPSGLVRIAAPMSFGQTEVAPLLPGLLRRFPDMRLDLHLADELVDLVGDGFDFALRISRPADSSLRTRLIRTVTLKLVAAPALIRDRTPTHPRALRDFPCLAYAYASNADRWSLTDRNGEQVLVPVSGPLRLNNAEVALPWLLAGHGIAVLPEFTVAAALCDGTLVELLPDWHLPPATLSLVMPPSVLRPAVVTAAIEFFARELAGPATEQPVLPRPPPRRGGNAAFAG